MGKFCSGNGKSRNFDAKRMNKGNLMKNISDFESNLEPHWVNF